jgi:hypothetical protein
MLGNGFGGGNWGASNKKLQENCWNGRLNKKCWPFLSSYKDIIKKIFDMI